MRDVHWLPIACLQRQRVRGHHSVKTYGKFLTHEQGETHPRLLLVPRLILGCPIERGDAHRTSIIYKLNIWVSDCRCGQQQFSLSWSHFPPAAITINVANHIKGHLGPNPMVARGMIMPRQQIATKSLLSSSWPLLSSSAQHGLLCQPQQRLLPTIFPSQRRLWQLV